MKPKFLYLPGIALTLFSFSVSAQYKDLDGVFFGKVISLGAGGA